MTQNSSHNRFRLAKQSLIPSLMHCTYFALLYPLLLTYLYGDFKDIALYIV